ncbi:MAG: chlorite dismutase family protein [Planctomycetes bacterium]|nr:chlorite dismutase family protein [Planctomycetota bacterium]
MQLTPTAFGIWSGGRFMHFGVDLGDEKLKQLVRSAYDAGVRTFVTADVYGEGDADSLLGEALAEVDRNTYCLVGAVGHDFYGTERVYDAFPRFTDPSLRGPKDYATYLRTAAEKSLKRLRTDRFDMLMLHNPDHTGYTHENVWKGMEALKKDGLTELLGVAPGPANGFTLDVIDCFERYGELIEWAMLILNPLEPWPGNLALPAAKKHNVKVLTRVVDYGGLFLGGLKPGMRLARHDHRSFRPAGWVEAAEPKMQRYREIAGEYGMTLLQLASRWNLANPAVESVVPTLLQEASPDAPRIEDLIKELAAVPQQKELSAAHVEEMGKLGDNSNCMTLKGGSSQYVGEPIGDQWPLTPELRDVGKRWKIEPDRELYYAGDDRDIREKGAPVHGVPQTSTRRRFLQLLCYGGCQDPAALAKVLDGSSLPYVLYLDANDPQGVGILFIVEDPDDLATKAREALNHDAFTALSPKPALTMIGRTYSSGREPDLEDWLLHKPLRTALEPNNRWAIWYPLRRKGEFETLPKAEQGKILFEHAMIGRTYGKAGFADDIRLACHGLDVNDNEFVLGIMGPDLYPLSKLVQTMRGTVQTSKYMASLGPFFVGRVFKQSKR